MCVVVPSFGVVCSGGESRGGAGGFGTACAVAAMGCGPSKQTNLDLANASRCAVSLFPARAFVVVLRHVCMCGCRKYVCVFVCADMHGTLLCCGVCRVLKRPHNVLTAKEVRVCACAGTQPARSLHRRASFRSNAPWGTLRKCGSLRLPAWTNTVRQLPWPSVCSMRRCQTVPVPPRRLVRRAAGRPAVLGRRHIFPVPAGAGLRRGVRWSPHHPDAGAVLLDAATVRRVGDCVEPVPYRGECFRFVCHSVILSFCVSGSGAVFLWGPCAGFSLRTVRSL